MDTRPYENKLGPRRMAVTCDGCGERLGVARYLDDLILCRECEAKLAQRREARRKLELEA